jgi:hypothetical protein
VLVGLCALAVVLVAARERVGHEVGRYADICVWSAPCAATFERVAGGTRLGLSVTCETEGVVIVRITFPTGMKLVSQRAVPTTTAGNGTVKFARPLPVGLTTRRSRTTSRCPAD